MFGNKLSSLFGKKVTIDRKALEKKKFNPVLSGRLGVSREGAREAMKHRFANGSQQIVSASFAKGLPTSGFANKVSKAGFAKSASQAPTHSNPSTPGSGMRMPPGVGRGLR